MKFAFGIQLVFSAGDQFFGLRNFAGQLAVPSQNQQPRHACNNGTAKSEPGDGKIAHTQLGPLKQARLDSIVAKLL